MNWCYTVLNKQPLAFPYLPSVFLDFFPFAAPHFSFVWHSHRASPGHMPMGDMLIPQLISNAPLQPFLSGAAASQPGESWATWAGEGVSLCGCSYWARRQQKHSGELGQIHISLGLVFNLWLHWCAAVESEIKVSYCAQKGIRSGGSSRSKS